MKSEWRVERNERRWVKKRWAGKEKKGKWSRKQEWQGRLNQWAHWARAYSTPRFFFLFEEPPTGNKCC